MIVALKPQAADLCLIQSMGDWTEIETAESFGKQNSDFMWGRNVTNSTVETTIIITIKKHFILSVGARSAVFVFLIITCSRVMRK